MKGKDLVSIADLSGEDIWRLINKAIALKKTGRSSVLSGQSLALIFEKPSLRTRVSFDVAMHQLGGHTIYLSDAEVGLGRREPVADVARVLSRYVDAMAARTFAHRTVELLAQHATVPVINGLSDQEHPCQALGDLLTIYEKKERLKGLTLAYIGDGNNVATSLLLAASLVGMSFHIASPEGYHLPEPILRRAQSFAAKSGASVLSTAQPQEAARGADILYTDVWTSMGQEAEAERRRLAFAGYQIDAKLLALASREALLMHPLPAHHGEEVAPGILDSPQSVVFDQAENRLHAQKAVLLELMARP